MASDHNTPYGGRPPAPWPPPPPASSEPAPPPPIPAAPDADGVSGPGAIPFPSDVRDPIAPGPVGPGPVPPGYAPAEPAPAPAQPPGEHGPAGAPPAGPIVAAGPWSTSPEPIPWAVAQAPAQPAPPPIAAPPPIGAPGAPAPPFAAPAAAPAQAATAAAAQPTAAPAEAPPARRYPPTAPVLPPARVSSLPVAPVTPARPSAPPDWNAPPTQAWHPPVTPGQPVWAANAPISQVHSAVSTASFTKVLLPLAIGAAVVVVLGVYGNVHEPARIAVNLAGFSGPLEAKVWLASGAFVLALVQLTSALVMYGKVPGIKSPSWIGGLHRWSGRLAFLLTIPVAIHCLYAVGFQTYDTRVMIHSILGCFFFGAFTVKMLILPKRGVPGWVLPLFGGLVFTGLVVLWLTSSFWFFTNVGVQF
jgi:hypothetical protein